MLKTVLVTAMMIATPVMAVECVDRDKLIPVLAEGYNEVPESFGLMPNGNVLEVFSSYDGTFTLLVTTPEGQSCVVGSGEGWMKAKDTLRKGEREG